jgi:predicted transcriptional regulator
VDESRSTVDNDKSSLTTLRDLNLDQKPYITFRIGLKQDAKHQGGMNLFGKSFGDYAQGIIMRMQYE